MAPMMNAMARAARKLSPLRSSANRRPNSCISSGHVTTPIMVRLVMNAATTVIDAP